MKKINTLITLALVAMSANADVVLTMGGQVCDPAKTVEVLAVEENYGDTTEPYIMIMNGQTDPQVKNTGSSAASFTVTVEAEEYKEFKWCGISTQCQPLAGPSETRNGSLKAGESTNLVLDVEFGGFDEDYNPLWGPAYYKNVPASVTIKSGNKSTTYHLNFVYDKRSSCGVYPEGTIFEFALENNKYYCAVGGTGKAQVISNPHLAATDIVWSSSDPDVLYVDEKYGLFLGLKDGIAEITAHPKSAPNIFAKATVIVGNYKEPVPAATPKIELLNGKILISCDTENAEIHYVIKHEAVAEEAIYIDPLDVNSPIIIEAYANAEGYLTSEIATFTFSATDIVGPKGDLNNDGEITIGDINPTLPLHNYFQVFLGCYSELTS